MPHHAARTSEAARATRWAGALLCLAVAAIHVVDQGGITATRDPRYVGVAYHVLEIAAVVAADRDLYSRTDQVHTSTRTLAAGSSVTGSG